MITFKKFLLENRIDWLKKNTESVDTRHDRFAKHQEPHDIIDHFAQHADPTRKKIYTQWIMNQYKKKNIRQEDHPRIHQTLTDFETHKQKLDKRDINQYKKLSDVEDAVEPHKEADPELSKRQQTKQIKHEGAELIHDDKELGVTVHHLATKEAAKHYGKGTKWCTAGDDNNEFENYNREGPLLLVQHKGRKYQMHAATEQLADEKNNETTLGDMSDVHEDIKKSLAKSKDPDVRLASIYFGNDHHKMTDDDVDTVLDQQHIPEHVAETLADNPRHAEDLADHEDPLVASFALKHHHIAKNKMYSSDEDTRALVAKNHKDLARKLIHDPSPYVRSAVASHPEHAHWFVNDPDKQVRASVASHSQHAGKLVNDPSKSVRRNVADHVEHAGKLVNDPDEDVRMRVARHPEHAGKLANDPNNNVRYRVAQHPKHAGELMNDPIDAIRRVVASRPEHAGKMVNDPSEDIREVIASHPEHADKMVNDPSWKVRMNVAKHSEHAHKMVNDPNPNVRRHAAMHPEVAKHLVNDPEEMVSGTAKSILRTSGR